MGQIRFEIISQTSRETSKSGSATIRCLLQYENPAEDYTPLTADIYVLTRTPPVMWGLRPLLRKSLTWETIVSHGPRYFLGFFVDVNYEPPETGETEEDALAPTPDPDSIPEIRRLVSRRFYGEEESLKVDTAQKTRHYFHTDASPHEKIQCMGYGDQINPTKEGPEGIDMPFSRFAWEENWSFSRSLMSDPYVLSIPDLKNHTNQSAFRGFKPNEVLLVDWTVDDPVPQTDEERQTAVVGMHFKFLVEPTEILELGGVTKIEKHGWEYVSAIFREVVSADQLTTSREVVDVRVQEIYKRADFSQLKIT